jgi:alkanesulfonate monooxygenase SsuD/methylene tetrahydromethanopterin reductase-like flavin-dependent oxidoreductase (luciferase family)
MPIPERSVNAHGTEPLAKCLILIHSLNSIYIRTGVFMPDIGLVAPYWSDLKTEELVETARLAEELGYHSIWVPEMWGRDAFSILGLIAANTKRIKLSTGIIPVFSRSPAVIAQTAATLDEISGGRMMLGLGTSGPAVIENWHGVPFDKPLQRTREYVEIIKMILGGGRVDYEGEIFSLKGFRLQFQPLRSVIPVLVAAIGPRNVRLAGESADGWIPFLVPVEGGAAFDVGVRHAALVLLPTREGLSNLGGGLITDRLIVRVCCVPHRL